MTPNTAFSFIGDNFKQKLNDILSLFFCRWTKSKAKVNYYGVFVEVLTCYENLMMKNAGIMSQKL